MRMLHVPLPPWRSSRSCMLCHCRSNGSRRSNGSSRSKVLILASHRIAPANGHAGRRRAHVSSAWSPSTLTTTVLSSLSSSSSSSSFPLSSRHAQQQQQHVHADLDNQNDLLEKAFWEAQIADLNGGKPININSSQQVSLAIFGRITSTTRTVLRQAASASASDDDNDDASRCPAMETSCLSLPPPSPSPPLSLTTQQRQIAALVLAYRERNRRCKRLPSQQPSQSQQRPTLPPCHASPLAKPRLQDHPNRVPSGVRRPAAFSSTAFSSDVRKKDVVHPTKTNQEEKVVWNEEYESLPDSAWLSSSSPSSSSSSSSPSSSSSTRPSSYESMVQSLFQGQSKIHPYWKEPLLQLSRPAARALVEQLDPYQCPMGYDPCATPRNAMRSTGTETTIDGGLASAKTAGKKGSFLAYGREQKEKYPDTVLLTRCGDFYEAFGIDAIMLVEHCGLNAMAGKAKAGCPIRNIQPTLDGLTPLGFRVAVYEEATDTDSSRGAAASGGSKSRIKNRFLAQIVSAASPTYLYDLVLLGNYDTLATAPPSRPYVGILSLSSGYTMVEVDVDEQKVFVYERLTAEAVACRLAAFPPADPLIYVPSMTEYRESKSSSSSSSSSYAGGASSSMSLPFLPSRKDSMSAGPGARLRTKMVPPTLVQEPRPGVTDVDRAKYTIVTTLLQLTERQEEEDEESSSGSRRRTSVDDFTVVTSSERQEQTNQTQTNPLYVETATQLGLMDDPAIPSLVSYLLPNSAPAASRRFLRRYLLTPPPPPIADAMRKLVASLKHSDSPPLPPLVVPPVGKVLALLRAGQASAQVFAELLRAMHSTILLLDTLQNSELVEALMVILEYESGMAADPASLRLRCDEASKVIETIVSPLYHSRLRQQDLLESDRTNYFGEVIPSSFLDRNEAIWRGRVRCDAIPESYARVQETAERLAQVVAREFWGMPLSELLQEPKRVSPIVQDIFNNIFALREAPRIKSNEVQYIHPRDRFGKVIRNRYTTEQVQNALSDYVAACERARLEVASVLEKLSQSLYDDGHIPAIVQASHVNLILSSAYNHAAKANSLGWSQAEIFEGGTHGDADTAGSFNNLWPYWMDRSDAVANSFDLSGMWILTAPNMAGKSTVLRSTAAVALLSACGLCAPIGPDSKVRRFDHIFVRGASSDVPSEQKSAFGAEMGDVAALLRCCGDRSLVFVDELGRGTSPRDGTRLAAAVLEAMAQSGMSGIFATHLHDILKLPLKDMGRIHKKMMAIHQSDSTGNEISDYTWTYRLVDGVCTDSMALATAARFGLPTEVLRRAEEFTTYLPDSANSISVNSSVTTRDDTTKDIHVVEQLSNLESVKMLVESKAEQRGTLIPARWSVPASLDGVSCVYILQLNGGDNPRYYVGETDNLRNRIEQHRAKGKCWLDAEAIALPIPAGKSEARALESMLIQTLAKAGVPLQSTADGRFTRTSRLNLNS